MNVLHLDGYDIFIGNGDAVSGEALRQLLREGRYTKTAVLVDGPTRRHCLPHLLQALDFEPLIIEIPSGELHKNLDTCRLIWGEMMRLGLDRHSLLINLGGGVIGDMGGFCAATFLRGIDFIQMPTTLLSQVDASIGGKLGIDFEFVKNSVGVFKNPKAVFVEPLFLKTLPTSEIRSGFAEMFKHALIADAAQWADLQWVTSLSSEGVTSSYPLTSSGWPDLIAASLAIKKRIVEADPFEKGIRKALNFGHTIGHAIESFSLQTERPLLHGEAVAAGILCESWLSAKVAGLPEASFQEIKAFVNRIYEPYPLTLNDLDEVMALMKKDKKNEAGRINFTLINPIGAAQIDNYCDEELIRQCLMVNYEL